MLDVVQSGSGAGGGSSAPSPPGKSYRRPASPQETARRKAWGTKWGKLVRDATASIRTERG